MTDEQAGQLIGAVERLVEIEGQKLELERQQVERMRAQFERMESGEPPPFVRQQRDDITRRMREDIAGRMRDMPTPPALLRQTEALENIAAILSRVDERLAEGGRGKE